MQATPSRDTPMYGSSPVKVNGTTFRDIRFEAFIHDSPKNHLNVKAHSEVQSAWDKPSRNCNYYSTSILQVSRAWNLVNDA